MRKLAITVPTIAAAEKLLGIAYTNSERKQMLDNIGGQIELATRRRTYKMPHSVAPATRFDPRLPDWKPVRAGPFRPVKLVRSPLPERDDDIAYAPVTALATWIKARRLSSTRLTQIYLDRIARIGPKLECFAKVTAKLALAQAKRADREIAARKYRGPLHGIPWGAKDILDTAGITTGWGAEPYRNRVPETDARVVSMLADAGAVMLGKTTVGAIAYGDIWYGGVTRNPFNIEEGSSGSSAGSATATAAGLVGFSIGTETLGSIVAPSVRCGATGLRPTFGRVSRTGAMPLCWSLDKIGPICRTVGDTALVLDAINGYDRTDPSSIAAPFAYNSRASIEGLRLGYFPADYKLDGIEELDRTVLEVAKRLGLRLVPLKRPDLPYDSLMSVLFAEASASFEELVLENLDDALTWQEPGAWPNTMRKSRFLSAIDHVQLDRLRRQTMQMMDEAFKSVEAMIGPALVGPMLIITNYTGHPCLTLRTGFRLSPSRSRVSLVRSRLDQGKVKKKDAKHSIPHAICVWGRLFDEGTILNIGGALEKSFGVWDQRPPLG